MARCCSLETTFIALDNVWLVLEPVEPSFSTAAVYFSALAVAAVYALPLLDDASVFSTDCRRLSASTSLFISANACVDSNTYFMPVSVVAMRIYC